MPHIQWSRESPYSGAWFKAHFQGALSIANFQGDLFIAVMNGSRKSFLRLPGPLARWIKRSFLESVAYCTLEICIILQWEWITRKMLLISRMAFATFVFGIFYILRGFNKVLTCLKWCFFSEIFTFSWILKHEICIFFRELIQTFHKSTIAFYCVTCVVLLNLSNKTFLSKVSSLNIP